MDRAPAPAVACNRIEIVAARQNHADGLLALVSDALVQEGGADAPVAKAPDGFDVSLDEIRALIGLPRSRTLVAIEDETVIGSVLVTRQPNGRPALGLLGVEPARRRRGLGGRLIAAAEAVAREEFGSDRIELCVLAERQRLIAYYAGFGFTLTGESRTVPLAETTLHFVVMAKGLASASIA